MANRKNVHVTFRKKEDIWAAKTEGNEKASGLFDTKKEALDVAKSIATNNKSELVIHKKDGTIQDKDSYGKDPHPPKDKVN